MTYYSSVDWWDTRYKIRRPLAFTAFELLPESESLYGVKLPTNSLNEKIKSDYSDLVVVYQQEGHPPHIIPRYVIEEPDGYTSIIFQPHDIIQYELVGDEYYPFADVEGATPVAGATPFSYVYLERATPSTSINEYFLYFGGKSETILDDSTLILDKDLLTISDLAQEENSTRWNFTKPTVDWFKNKSLTPGARCMFEFIGHRADFYFRTGPMYGEFEYWINDGERTVVDCYASQESETKLVTIETNELGVNKVRFHALGTGNPAATDYSIDLVRVEYHQVLIGVAQPEEFYSIIGKAYTVGS